MLRVIAVDDEKMALERLERVLEKEKRVTLEGKFRNAKDAMEFVRKNLVDIAFLDIDMPLVDGLELAEQLIQKNPALEVIFVTAYSQYALKAIQAHAHGYLLKPVEIEDIREQIDHVLRKRKSLSETRKDSMLKVHCFGPFHCHPIEDDSQAILFRTAKAEELFALLLHYQGKPASKEMLIEVLWPEADKIKASNYFYVTCTYVRKAFADMKHRDILLRERDNYRLNMTKLHCDLFQFMTSIKEFSEAASDLYTAPYFEDKSYEWAEKTRRWFENQFFCHQMKLSTYYELEGDDKKAIDAIQRILDHNPFEEEAVERLLLLKIKSGDIASASLLYKEYSELIEKELGIKASENLRQLIILGKDEKV